MKSSSYWLFSTSITSSQIIFIKWRRPACPVGLPNAVDPRPVVLRIRLVSCSVDFWPNNRMSGRSPVRSIFDRMTWWPDLSGGTFTWWPDDRYSWPSYRTLPIKYSLKQELNGFVFFSIQNYIHHFLLPGLRRFTSFSRNEYSSPLITCRAHHLRLFVKTFAPVVCCMAFFLPIANCPFSCYA